MTQRLLEIRNKLKERKPEFIRQDTHRRKRLSLKWRKPKGIHSKIRHHFKGRRKMPSPGYKSPIKAKGLHASGLKIVSAFSIGDLTKIKSESEGVIISKTVGMKKRIEIMKKAKELNIRVLNLNVDEHIKKIEEFVSSKKKKESKKTKKEEVKELKETKESKGKTELSDEQKKETNASELGDERARGELSHVTRTRSHVDQKAEKDKILTKKV